MSKTKPAGRISRCLFFVGMLLVIPDAVSASDARASLSVHVAKIGNREQEEHLTQNGSVVTTVEREITSCVLEIEVENQSERTSDYDIEWCVIAKRTAANDSASLVVSDAGKIRITREGRATGTETVKPRSFVFTITSKNYEDSDSGDMDSDYSQQTREGDIYAGYIVLLKSDSQTLAQDSNDDRFSTDEWAERCEKAALAKNKAKAAPKK